MSTSSEEDEYDDEFDALVNKYERCPICDAQPISLTSTRQRNEHGVEDEDFVLIAQCGNEHMYSVERRFDIE